MTGKQSQSRQVFEGQHQQRDVGITFLQFLRAKCLMEEGGGRCRTKPPVLFFYHTYPMNMCAHLCQTQETGGGQGGSVVQLYSDQNRTCFLFPTCVFFPNYARTSKSHRKEAEKKHILLLTDDGEHVGGEVHLSPPPNIGPHALYVWHCLCAFPPIARAALTWRAGKKTAAPMAFDVHVLWSHVNALSVKSFCCPSA